MLLDVSNRESLELRYAESRVEAFDLVNELNAPVIFYDRDWPNAEWRTTVHTFASHPHRPCVILASRVVDDYLWQELVRRGGHDVLAKPLRIEDVTRAIKLALSFRKGAKRAANE